MGVKILLDDNCNMKKILLIAMLTSVQVTKVFPNFFLNTNAKFGVKYESARHAPHT